MTRRCGSGHTVEPASIPDNNTVSRTHLLATSLLGIASAWRLRLAVLLLLGGLGQAALAQDDSGFKKLQALPWKTSTTDGNIAGKATFKLDGGLRYLDSAGTDEFLRLTGNLPSPDMFTVAKPDLSWFAVVHFVDEGYVADNETIDADALLKTLKENNLVSQEERKKQGLRPLYLDGWFIPPRYDRDTKRLEWATALRTDSGARTVNFSTKVLGRKGHMNFILVSDPQNLEHDIGEFKTALKGFEYVSGERYAEWKQGDRVAAYGLGALVLGGAAAVATKKGFWSLLVGVLAAGWKFIAAAVVAGLAGLGSFFKRKKSSS